MTYLYIIHSIYKSNFIWTEQTFHFMKIPVEKLEEQSKRLLDDASPKVLQRIAATKRSVRERAISTLTKSLVSEQESDDTVFQIIPLELLSKRNILEAIWFIETTGKRWDTIEWEVVETVLKSAISEIENHLVRGNKKLASTLSSSIDSLFRMAKTHVIYQDIPNLHRLMGTHEEIKNNPYKALEHYDKAIGYGSIDGYIDSVGVYEELGLHEASLSILEDWWITFSDTRFLHNSIFILCRVWKIDEALEKYAEFKSIKEGKVPSFLLYKWYIENDNDVTELGQILNTYIAAWEYTYDISLQKLVIDCSEYIRESIHEESEKLTRLLVIEDETLEERKEYAAILQRRLWLMQTDILTLKNHRYIDDYFADFWQLWLNGEVFSQSILQDFFAEHSLVSKHDEEKAEEYYMHRLFNDISGHAQMIRELFQSPSFLELHENSIIPIIRECAKRIGEYDDAMVLDHYYSLNSIQKISDSYDNLRPKLRENYEDFIHRFDLKYNIFYRRTIQNLVLDSEMTREKIPEALRDDPTVGLLYWMEKIIMWYMIDPEELSDIANIINEYSFYSLQTKDALLFSHILYTVEPGGAFDFLVEYPEALNIPEAIYLITEVLCSMDAKNQKTALHAIHTLAREKYSGRGFFDHAHYIHDNIYQNNPNDDDLQYVFLSNGNISTLQNKEKMESMINFLTADEYGNIEWFVHAGNVAENTGDYDTAIQYFERAFCQDDTLQIVEKILNCTIRNGVFDKAQTYIDYALKKWYNIWQYIIAFYLWGWNAKSAFRQCISMHCSGVNIEDTPPWTILMLNNAIIAILEHPDMRNGDWDELKILASYIRIFMQEWDSLLALYILKHWDFVESIYNCYEWEILDHKIRHSIYLLIWNNQGLISEEPGLKTSLEILEIHAQTLYNTLQKMFEYFKEKWESREAEQIFVIQKDFCVRVYSMLKRFPESIKYTPAWLDRLHFNPIDSSSIIIQNTPNNKGFWI